MTLKIVNALRIISIVILIFVFFIAYAGLPEQVLILLDGAGNPTTYIEKNFYFYGALSLIIITNLLFFVLANLLVKSISAKAQLSGKYINVLAIITNIFFAVALTFLGILNGQENFDYSSYSPFIYTSLGLFVVWAISFLVSLAKSKKTV